MKLKLLSYVVFSLFISQHIAVAEPREASAASVNMAVASGTQNAKNLTPTEIKARLLLTIDVLEGSLAIDAPSLERVETDYQKALAVYENLLNNPTTPDESSLAAEEASLTEVQQRKSAAAAALKSAQASADALLADLKMSPSLIDDYTAAQQEVLKVLQKPKIPFDIQAYYNKSTGEIIEYDNKKKAYQQYNPVTDKVTVDPSITEADLDDFTLMSLQRARIEAVSATAQKAKQKIIDTIASANNISEKEATEKFEAYTQERAKLQVKLDAEQEMSDEIAQREQAISDLKNNKSYQDALAAAEQDRQLAAARLKSVYQRRQDLDAAITQLSDWYTNGVPKQADDVLSQLINPQTSTVGVVAAIKGADASWKTPSQSPDAILAQGLESSIIEPYLDPNTTEEERIELLAQLQDVSDLSTLSELVSNNNARIVKHTEISPSAYPGGIKAYNAMLQRQLNLKATLIKAWSEQLPQKQSLPASLLANVLDHEDAVTKLIKYRNLLKSGGYRADISKEDVEQLETLAEDAIQLQTVETNYGGSQQVKDFGKAYNNMVVQLQESIAKGLSSAITSGNVEHINTLNSVIETMQSNFSNANTLAQGKDPRDGMQKFLDGLKAIFLGKKWVNQKSLRDDSLSDINQMYQSLQRIVSDDTGVEQQELDLSGAISKVSTPNKLADNGHATDLDDPKVEQAYEALNQQLKAVNAAIKEVVADYNSLNLTPEQQQEFDNKITRLTEIAEGLKNFAKLTTTAALKLAAQDEQREEAADVALADLDKVGQSSDTGLPAEESAPASAELHNEAISATQDAIEETTETETAKDPTSAIASEAATVATDTTAIDAKGSQSAQALADMAEDYIDQAIVIMSELGSASTKATTMEKDIQRAVTDLTAVKTSLSQPDVKNSIVSNLKAVIKESQTGIDAGASELGGDAEVGKRIDALQQSIEVFIKYEEPKLPGEGGAPPEPDSGDLAGRMLDTVTPDEIPFAPVEDDGGEDE